MTRPLQCNNNKTNAVKVTNARQGEKIRGCNCSNSVACSIGHKFDLSTAKKNKDWVIVASTTKILKLISIALFDFNAFKIVVIKFFREMTCIHSVKRLLMHSIDPESNKIPISFLTTTYLLVMTIFNINLGRSNLCKCWWTLQKLEKY